MTMDNSHDGRDLLVPFRELSQPVPLDPLSEAPSVGPKAVAHHKELGAVDQLAEVVLPVERAVVLVGRAARVL